MNLQLEKPLCVFDLETTGLDISKDRIVQIAILKIHPDGKKEELNLLINPEMNISESKHQNVRCCLLPRWPLPRLERLAGFHFQVTFKVGGSTFDAVQLDLLWLHFKEGFTV